MHLDCVFSTLGSGLCIMLEVRGPGGGATMLPGGGAVKWRGRVAKPRRPAAARGPTLTKLGLKLDAAPPPRT